MRQYTLLCKSPWPYHVIRVGLALIFIYAGVTKLTDPEAFARTVSSYDLIPVKFLPLVAIGLPAFEVLAGISLVLDVKGSLAVITGLLMMFVFVLGYGVANNMEIDCGCFGAGHIADKNSLRNALLCDLALMGTTGFLYSVRYVRKRNIRFAAGGLT